MPRLTETKIQQILISGLMKKGHNYVIPNLYFYAWESDLISTSVAGLVNEYEIKISTSDFGADFKKKKKHDALDARLSNSKQGIPNYFWYVCPRNLISVEDVPNYAGLIWIEDKGPVTKKKAPRLHTNKLTPKQMWKLGKTQMWRLWEKVYAPKGWRPPAKVRRKRRRRRRRR